MVVVQWRQRNIQKSVQSCCFALSSYCFFTFSSPLHLKLPIVYDTLWSVRNRIFSVQIELLLLIASETFFDSAVFPSFLVRKAGLKGVTKVFKHGRKNPWVPTLTGPFPNGQENAGSSLGTKNALSWVVFVSTLRMCAYSADATFVALWKTFSNCIRWSNRSLWWAFQQLKNEI